MPFKKGGGHHKGRKGTRISLNATRTPTRFDDHENDDDDEQMMDADVDDQPQQMEGDEDEDDVAVTPAADDDDEDDEPPTITAMPRRRGRGGGRGRGRRSMAAGGDTPEPGEDGSESGTPIRRRRGRPLGSGAGRGSRGGFRGRRRGQRDEGPRTVIDKDGTVYDVVDDEAQVDFDEEGEQKVDQLGNLQGDREYRVRTFKIMGKGDRLYMLSTEPARCCGFRDSYLFFTKHPKLYKVVVGEDAKKDLISRDVLPNSYKGRNIGVVTARSVFREFGAKIIIGGRRVIDDYKVTMARENGEVEGELADPQDLVPEKHDEYNRNRYVAWFGASDVYKTSSGTIPNKQGPVGKRRNNITLQNWQFMHAREAMRFNSTLTAARQANLNGVYDQNTNMMFYPKIMQPTHAKWEYIAPEDERSAKRQLINGSTNGHMANGDASDIETGAENDASSTIFSQVPPTISRNFTIIDTVYKAPPISNAGYPGPDGHVEDPTSGPNGLSTVPQNLVDELPEACRKAFEEARATELGWKNQWSTETHSGQRGILKIGFSGYPV